MPVDDYPVNQVLKSKSPLTDLQVGICDSSEQITWANCNAYPELRTDGEIDRITVNFIDITSQKEAIPFHDIVSLCKDAILVTEASRFEEPGPKIIYANQAFLDLTGYTWDEIAGKTPRILQGEQTDPQARSRIRKALSAQRPIRETILNYRKDGTAYWNEMTIYPLKNDYNEVIYYVGVQRDVSKRKQREEQVQIANQQLLQSNVELKELDEMKNQTMGIVAHDLRNPLYAVATSIELIKECSNIEDPELVPIIETSANNMNAIIEDLLESQLLHTADLSLTKQKHCLVQLIHEVHDLNAQRAKKKGISIKKQSSEQLEAYVDYGKLLRAVDNLLSNAIKFSPYDSEITIGCEILDKGMIRLYVKDAGPGLTDEDMSKVFKPFQRLSAQPTADEHSTGLGLSIVKKIAKLHGGDAGVISQYLKGAVFYLDIPI